jgi:hypothetical protein
MAITRTAMIDDDGSGTTGTIFNNAWKQELYNQIDGAIGGVWIDVPYVAGDFTATGGTWTVSGFTTFAYRVSGKTMTLALYATNTTIGGTPASLIVKLPGGGVGANRSMGQPFNYASGAAGVGWALTQTGSGAVLLYRDILGTAWPAGTTHISAVLTFNIL